MPNYIGWSGYYQAIGLERGGKLSAGVVYTDASPTNVVTSIVCEGPITRRFLYVAFWYPFGQLQVRRITALVEEWNEKSLRFCEGLGFVREGRMRKAATNGGDIIVMGILRHEAGKWLVMPP
jgi:hypothetical protein